MQRVSALGLLALRARRSRFVGFDWLMSLDPHWFSSLYGGIFLAGSALAALTFLILVANFLRPARADARGALDASASTTSARCSSPS